MSKPAVSVSLVYNHIGLVKAQARRKAEQIVRKTAFDIEAAAKANTPVDTGALKNSIYTATDKNSNYSEAAETARSKNPKANILVEGEKPESLTATVGPSVDYGIHVELGTHKKGARPFLGPAAEGARPAFLKAMESLLDG